MIHDFVEKTDFDDTLIKLNKEVTSIKTKHESDYEKSVRCQKNSNYQRLFFFFLGRMYFTSDNGSQNIFIYRRKHIH